MKVERRNEQIAFSAFDPGGTTKRIPLQVPLLAPLLALCLGYALIEVHREVAPIVWLTTTPLGAFAILILVRRGLLPLRLLVVFSISFFVAIFNYKIQERLHPTQTIEIFQGSDLPPREVFAEIRLERLWTSATAERIGGIGRIEQLHSPAKVAIGQRVVFDALRNFQTADLPHRGSLLAVRGVLRELPPVEIETERNFDRWLADEGVFYRIGQGLWLDTLEAATPSVWERINARFERQLRHALPAESAIPDVYVAMLLGKRAALSREQIESFRNTGTMHFFAISGLHIGVIAVTIHQLLLLLRLPRRTIPFVGLILLGTYVMSTGASPSALRAFSMTAFFWMSLGMARQPSPLAAWTNSALLVLIVAPQQLWNIGFQLSYTVVAGILFFGLPLYRDLKARFVLFAAIPERELSRWQRWTVSGVHGAMLYFAIGLSAWLASSPLTLYHFGLFVPAAVPLNMLLVLFGTCAIITGVVSLFFGLIGLAFIGGFFNYGAAVFLVGMQRIVHFGEAQPIRTMFADSVAIWPILAGLGLFFASALWLERTDAGRNEPRKLRSYSIPAGFIAAGCLLGAVVS